jgi:L-lactate dehydrogenase complex protein LldG
MESKSRLQILEKIRQNRPSEGPALPENIHFEPNFDDLALKFADTLGLIGGTAVFAPDFAFIAEDLRLVFPGAQQIVHGIAALSLVGIHPETITDPHDLALADLAILPGQLGVAESAAIWLDETNFGGHRVLPFIAQHLAIVLERKNLVHNLHAAYAQVNAAATGFGLWLAGPSKTADIEQAMVIGAHGARSLRVYLLG